MGGLMSITGDSEKVGGKAQKVGVAVTDLMTGMYATTGILAALNYRNATGIGTDRLCHNAGDRAGTTSHRTAGVR